MDQIAQQLKAEIDSLQEYIERTEERLQVTRWVGELLDPFEKLQGDLDEAELRHVLGALYHARHRFGVNGLLAGRIDSILEQHESVVAGLQVRGASPPQSGDLPAKDPDFYTLGLGEEEDEEGVLPAREEGVAAPGTVAVPQASFSLFQAPDLDGDEAPAAEDLFADLEKAEVKPFRLPDLDAPWPLPDVAAPAVVPFAPTTVPPRQAADPAPAAMAEGTVPAEGQGAPGPEGIFGPGAGPVPGPPPSDHGPSLPAVQPRVTAGGQPAAPPRAPDGGAPNVIFGAPTPALQRAASARAAEPSRQRSARPAPPRPEPEAAPTPRTRRRPDPVTSDRPATVGASLEGLPGVDILAAKISLEDVSTRLDIAIPAADRSQLQTLLRNKLCDRVVAALQTTAAFEQQFVLLPRLARYVHDGVTYPCTVKNLVRTFVGLFGDIHDLMSLRGEHFLTDETPLLSWALITAESPQESLDKTFMEQTQYLRLVAGRAGIPSHLVRRRTLVEAVYDLIVGRMVLREAIQRRTLDWTSTSTSRNDFLCLFFSDRGIRLRELPRTMHNRALGVVPTC
ncbi:MAG: hypothetical protein AB1505_10065 [Candidatus Latescibacterota bacterium]